jgi:hypothetical protein
VAPGSWRKRTSSKRSRWRRGAPCRSLPGRRRSIRSSPDFAAGWARSRTSATPHGARQTPVRCSGPTHLGGHAVLQDLPVDVAAPYSIQASTLRA